ncbi:MAG TPA: TetR family transcriptional regulator [Stellaceae bacterium]|nr:TetR family transcriptional regulator [Stellaceae bacterium]
MARRRSAAKRGRRPGESPTARQIIDFAEAAFAAHGYAGTSLRDISEGAQVNPALIRYYFGSKEKLFCEVVLRRGRQVTRERIRLLDELERQPGKRADIEEIVRAFLLPIAEMRREGPGGLAFVRLMARLQSEPQTLIDELRRRIWKQSTNRYIAAIRRALPELDAATIYWRMLALIGAYVYAMSDANNMVLFSNGLCSPDDTDETVRQLVPFLCGGLQAGTPSRPD